MSVASVAVAGPRPAAPPEESKTDVEVDLEKRKVPVNLSCLYNVRFRGFTDGTVSGRPNLDLPHEDTPQSFRAFTSQHRVTGATLLRVLLKEVPHSGAHDGTPPAIWVRKMKFPTHGVPPETILPGELDAEAYWNRVDAESVVELPQLVSSFTCVCVQVSDRYFHFGLRGHLTTVWESAVGRMRLFKHTTEAYDFTHDFTRVGAVTLDYHTPPLFDYSADGGTPASPGADMGAASMRKRLLAHSK